jgi:coenzyme F420-reducing hydrogenase delta subunit
MAGAPPGRDPRRPSYVEEVSHRVCIVGASGRLGTYMVEHALNRGHDVVGVCRQESVGKLDAYRERIEIVPGPTNDPEVIARAVAGCDGVLVVLVPWGMKHYASGTAQAVLDQAPSGARLVFSCGWWPARDDKDVYSWKLKLQVQVVGRLARLARLVDLDDQVEATRRVFSSDTLWTVVRGSDLEEGPSQGLPVWSRHVGDPILESNRTRRIDFALFMVDALTNEDLVHEAPAIVSCEAPSARAHAGANAGATGAPGVPPR